MTHKINHGVRQRSHLSSSYSKFTWKK